MEILFASDWTTCSNEETQTLPSINATINFARRPAFEIYKKIDDYVILLRVLELEFSHITKDIRIKFKTGQIKLGDQFQVKVVQY